MLCEWEIAPEETGTPPHTQIHNHTNRRIQGHSIFIDTNPHLITILVFSRDCATWGCSLLHACSVATPCTVARQALLSMVFPRQEYGSGLPFPVKSISFAASPPLIPCSKPEWGECLSNPSRQESPTFFISIS